MGIAQHLDVFMMMVKVCRSHILEESASIHCLGSISSMPCSLHELDPITHHLRPALHGLPSSSISRPTSPGGGWWRCHRDGAQSIPARIRGSATTEKPRTDENGGNSTLFSCQKCVVKGRCWTCLGCERCSRSWQILVRCGEQKCK